MCYWEVSALLRWGRFQPKHCLWTGLQVNNFSCHSLACGYLINVFLTHRWWGKEELSPLPLLLSIFFHTATSWCPRGRLHCNLPSLLWSLYTLQPPPHTSPRHFILPPVPALTHSVCYYYVYHYSHPLSTPVPLPVCITFKTLMFTFKSVCAPLLNLSSQLLYSSHFLLLSSDLFLQLLLQLEQTPSLYAPKNVPLFLFIEEAENSSYHPSIIPLRLKNTGDN